MSVAPGASPAGDRGDDVVSVENVTRYWHGAAPAFDRGLDPDVPGLGRSAEEIRAWELHFRRVIGPPPRRVLDVGTGAGSLSLLLASLGYEVTACDAVERMLEFTAAKVKRTGLRVDLHRALADDLPFESGAFDAVASKLVVWTLLEPERAVAEWMRVTVPGGRILAIDDWNVPPRSALEWARIRMNDELFRFRGGQPRSRRAQLPLGERFRDAPQRTAAVLAPYPGAIYVYGHSSISEVQLETLGLTNAFAGVQDRYIELNVEELLARNPDVLVVAYQMGENADAVVQRVRELPGAERLTAVREGQIIPIEGQAIRGGTQPIELLDDMAGTLAGFQ